MEHIVASECVIHAAVSDRPGGVESMTKNNTLMAYNQVWQRWAKEDFWNSIGKEPCDGKCIIVHTSSHLHPCYMPSQVPP